MEALRRFAHPTLAALSLTLVAVPRPSRCDDHRRAWLYRPLSRDTAMAGTRSMECQTSAPMKDRMVALIRRVQNDICTELSKVDGRSFREDEWTRDRMGGYGCSRVLQDGKVFEKAGVNISVVQGQLPDKAVQYMNNRGKNLEPAKEHPYFVCGISMVLHPHNPMAPTMHLNYRYFEIDTGRKLDNGEPEMCSWFGGGADLTPAYLFESDARHFHAVYKTVLDQTSPDLYPEMKKTCDDYFWIPHREEHRGIGGIFFDDFDDDQETTFQMVRSCANAMLDSYLPILQRRMNMPFTPEQKRWQQVRRGRYVEFNLMYDRGTKFGLATPHARIESILMSLPLVPRFEYMNVPEPGSWEGQTLEVLKHPREWLTEMDVVKAVSTKALMNELAKRVVT